MKEIKLWFSDFYQGFEPSNNYLYHILSRHYDLILDEENPDYLIYSCYSHDFLKYRDSIRIFYTGENLVPDFNLCDYGIGFNYMNFGERYLRFPNFALIPDQFKQLIKSNSLSPEDLKKKKYFCNFIYSNSKADPKRDTFFHLLNKYKKVLSPGRHLNNTSLEIGERATEDWMYTKLNFQSKFKFSIAFENSSSPGYTTEKLMHAYITRTIPIYWGNPEATKDFNPKSLINCHEFNNFEEVLQKIIEVDQNDQLALNYLNAPPFRSNQIPINLREATLENFLKAIFDQGLNDCLKRPRFGTTMAYEKYFTETKVTKEKTFLSNLKGLLRGN